MRSSASKDRSANQEKAIDLLESLKSGLCIPKDSIS